MLPRRILPFILDDLKRKKMVFLSGPRQCGKTTLTQAATTGSRKTAYFNWDIDEHRHLLQRSQLDEEKVLWIFDELHKFRRWRNWLKGIYDLHGREHEIIVTGSARLDLYSRGGDSLQGRYFHYRLHPLTISEAAGLPTH